MIGELPNHLGVLLLYKLANANDSGPNGYNLTNNNTVTFPVGKFGLGANFVAASNQSLTVTATNANINTSQTWIIWLNVGATGGDAFPFGFREAGGGNYKGIYVHDGAPEQNMAINFGTTLTPNEITSATGSLVKSAWKCIIVVWDSVANTLTLHYNGKKVVTSTTGAPQNGTALFGLGRWGAYTTGPYQGLADDAAIMNYAWSDQRVKRWLAWTEGKLI